MSTIDFGSELSRPSDEGLMGRVSEGLVATFQLLSKTSNEAATRVLIRALDSPHRLIQECALETILSRRSEAGHLEILRRLDGVNDRWERIIAHYPGRMSRALRSAILSPDHQVCSDGCRSAVSFHAYDLVPTLVAALEGPPNKNTNLIGDTLIELARHLQAELSGLYNNGNRSDLETVWRYLVSTLELSLQRFSRHHRREIGEAFLLLASKDNALLKNIMQDPDHPAFVTIGAIFSGSQQEGVIGLLVSLLEDPRVPSVALSAIVQRTDPKFVDYLLKDISSEPSASKLSNLKRITDIGWLNNAQAILSELDDESQQGAVNFLTHSGLPRVEALNLIVYLVENGKPGGRRAAAVALGEYDSNILRSALRRSTSDDQSPSVREVAEKSLEKLGRSSEGKGPVSDPKD